MKVLLYRVQLKTLQQLADERCTAEKRSCNDLFGPELSVPVPSIQKPETKGSTTRSKLSLAAIVFPESCRTPTATLPRTGANVSRLARWSRSA